jgi:hypothetical protein
MKEFNDNLILNEVSFDWVELKYIGKKEKELSFSLKINNEKFNFLEKFKPNEIKVFKFNNKINILEFEYKDIKENLILKEPLSKFEGKWLKTQILTPGYENVYFKNFNFNESLSFNYILGILTLFLLLFLYLKFRVK